MSSFVCFVFTQSLTLASNPSQIQTVHQKLDHGIHQLQSRSPSGNAEGSPLNDADNLQVKSPSTEDVRELSSPDDVHRLDDKIESLISHVENALSASDKLKIKLEMSKAAEEVTFFIIFLC